MSRRRPTLGKYLVRRWRALGLVIVLVAGSLLVLGITDRGHDPVWTMRDGPIDTVAVAPDGGMVYALVREGENITRLEARSGADGHLVWESPVQAPRALLHSAPEGVVVATDFPRAFLTYYGADGAVHYQIPLEGNPRSVSVEGDHVALALQAPGNPVLVFRDGELTHVHRFGSFVNSLEIRSGRLGVGTGGGQVSVFSPNGSIAFNGSFAMSVRSLSMSGDGLAIVVGGYSIMPGDLSGVIAFIDLGVDEPLRWTQPTASGVGLVDLDRNGIWAMAVLESPPSYTLEVVETSTGRVAWAHPVGGNVARDDAGANGGASISPDGRHLVVGTLRHGIVVRDVSDGAVRWTYAVEGTTLVAHAREAPSLFVANGRLVQNGPYDTILSFRVQEEPWTGQVARVAVVIVLVGAAGALVVVGYGYWRVRRSY